MKTIGLIGGMSWESTALYYRLINEGVRDRLGGLHSACILLLSINFAPMQRMQQEGRWETAGDELATCAQTLERAGADCIALTTNTMHKVAAVIERRIAIPFIHIADPTSQAVLASPARQVGLLGTRFTMEESFYRERLERAGLQVLVPDADERTQVNRIIYDELCHGQISEDSRALYRHVMGQLVSRGAQAIILGCTEIGLLVGTDDASVPIFDTTALHAQALTDFALA